MRLKVALKTPFNSFENLIPDRIRFTSSSNEETSTISLNFYNPTILLDLKKIVDEKEAIKVSLNLYPNLKYTSKEIKIVWVNGKPFLLEVIFLVTSNKESQRLKRYIEMHF